MRYVIILASYPFVVLGFLWQFAAGSFVAGRIASTRWMVLKTLAWLQTQPGKPPFTPTGQQAPLGKCLH